MSVESTPDRRRFRLPFVARILIAMVLGVVVGLTFGEKAARLGELGAVIISLIKALAGPMLFLAVVDAFLRTNVEARAAGVMIAISATNGLIAIIIGLSLSNLLRPGDHLSIPIPPSGSSLKSVAGSSIRSIDFVRELGGYLPKNVVQPFLENSVITIVVLAVLSGLALRKVKNEQISSGETAYLTIESAVTTLFRALELMLAGVIVFVPLAVFGVVAQTLGREGFRPIKGLAAYVGVALLGLAIQVLVVYQAWIVLVARTTLRRFWSGAKEAVVYAMGASSSLATLPVTLRCLDRMKVSPQSARLAACVGTNLNNDGILLYEAMAVLFVAQVYGIHLSVSQQILAAASCVIAGVGIAAIPDAGLISLSLVLGTVGLPLEIVPLLLTVDWILSRGRAMTNVTSDILVAVLLDRFSSSGPCEDSPESESQPAANEKSLEDQVIPRPMSAFRLAQEASDPDGI